MAIRKKDKISLTFLCKGECFACFPLSQIRLYIWLKTLDAPLEILCQMDSLKKKKFAPSSNDCDKCIAFYLGHQHWTLSHQFLARTNHFFWVYSMHFFFFQFVEFFIKEDFFYINFPSFLRICRTDINIKFISESPNTQFMFWFLSKKLAFQIISWYHTFQEFLQKIAKDSSRSV